MRLTPPALACASLLLAACTGEPSPAPAASPATPAPPVPSAPAASAPPADVAPVTGHPRLWITAADLPRLRGWATSRNPVWEHGVVPATKQALEIYDKEFYPGGQPNPRWPDPGTDNWVARATEQYAQFFAFLSLVDPDPAARAAHAVRARNLLMVVIRAAEQGKDPDRDHAAPFRGPAFSTYNRANGAGGAFGLTVDWIYPSLSADDKARIRRVFLRWADENVHGATTAQEHPEPIGLLADPRLLADRRQLRWTANNYYTGHMRQLTLYGLCLDPADDPPLDPSAPPGKLGNTLRSYLDDAVGAWLYQQYAVYEDPAIAAPALGVPPEGLGTASGGLSPEGFLYGASLGALHEALLALYTSGHRDARALGPQIGLIESGYWDRVTDSVLHSLVAEPAPLPGAAYLGPVYPVAGYGDTLRTWLTPDFAPLFLSMIIHDAAAGPARARRVEAARWIVVNALQGTGPGLFKRIADVWGNSASDLPILHFLALDPAAPPPADPRPALPRAFVDRALGRVLTRSAWGPQGTAFDYKCSYESIGHQFGDCNQFELWRKGEWLVKERSGYANDPWVMTSVYHNTLALQNRVTSGADKPKSLQWFEGAWERGGQFTLGMNAGDPQVRLSVAPGAGGGWAYAQGDATNLYNRPSSQAGDEATDVLHASRSIAWIAPDFVVVYDRATSRSDGRYKRFHLVTGGDPAVSGHTATFTTPRGQKLYVETLLPRAAVLQAAPVTPFNHIADGEPSRSTLVVEDPKSPRDVRFLHVLQGADAGAAPAAVSLVQSRAGTPFAGAVVGRYAAVFPVDLGAAFTRVTYAVPATTTGQLVGGLQPGAKYDVTVRPAGSSVEVTIAPGAAYTADEGGVITLGL